MCYSDCVSHLPIGSCSFSTFSLLCCASQGAISIWSHPSGFYVGLANGRHRQKAGGEGDSQVIFPSFLPEMSHLHAPKDSSSF